METTILWTGIAYHSLEYCVLTNSDESIDVNSVIVGAHDDKIYRVDYSIKINRNWESFFVEVKAQLSDKKEEINYHSDGRGNWTKNGAPANEFNGCIDIDISLTPFTNSLPINRLQWELNKPQQIKVLFFDVLSQEIIPVQQRYTKLSNSEYKFENVPNDFEAIITVDESGMVVNYPELFVRKRKRHYQEY
jgi:uncharacterized protein